MNVARAARRHAAGAARLFLVAALGGGLLACDGDAASPPATTSTVDAAVPSAPDVLAAAASTTTARTATTVPAASTSATASTGTTAASPTTSASTTATSTTAINATAALTAEEQAAAAQRLLLAHGYDIGEVDGALGPVTAAALADFQTARGLPASGLLDPATWNRLERSGGALSAELPASVVVDLSEQQLYVFNAGGQQVTRWPISTGGPGNETPTGSFAVVGRQRVGTAKDVETVHMDYFTVFNGDIGFHGIPWVGSRDERLWTPLGQYGVSHGCIRMEDANAQYLYNFLADGASVTVQD